MIFSVLICTYNRHLMLSRALDALVNRTLEKPDQIVVVNGGDGNADEVIRSFQHTPGVELVLVHTINRNLATSRNVGIPFCSGDIVAMTDDDAEVFPDWVTQIKRTLQEHPEAGAVGGAVIGAQSSSNFLSRLSDEVTFVSKDTPCYVRTLPGVNVAYRKDVINRVGPQDEMLIRGEDVDFNWRVKRLGVEIYYDPQIRVIHHHRPSLRQFLRQHYMYGRAYYFVRRKWPDMYCVYPHRLVDFRGVLKAGFFVISTIYYPLTFSLRMRRPVDKVAAFPVLVANQLVWKGGMVREKLATLLNGRTQ